MRRIAAAIACAAAAIAGAAAVSGAQPVPAALAVVAGNSTQVIAQVALGQWSVVGAARACNASAFKLAVRDGTVRATAGLVLVPVRSVAAANRAPLDAAIGPLFAARAREQRIDEQNLSRAPLSVDALYAATSPAGVAYYFEASKRLHDTAPPADAAADDDPDPRGVVRVTVSGWLRDRGGIEPAGTKSELHWDPVDDRGRSAMAPGLVPLGVVGGAEPIWVMRRAVGDRVSYLLYAVHATAVRLLLTVPALSC